MRHDNVHVSAHQGYADFHPCSKTTSFTTILRKWQRQRNLKGIVMRCVLLKTHGARYMPENECLEIHNLPSTTFRGTKRGPTPSSFFRRNPIQDSSSAGAPPTHDLLLLLCVAVSWMSIGGVGSCHAGDSMLVLVSHCPWCPITRCGFSLLRKDTSVQQKSL